MNHNAPCMFRWGFFRLKDTTKKRKLPTFIHIQQRIKHLCPNDNIHFVSHIFLFHFFSFNIFILSFFLCNNHISWKRISLSIYYLQKLKVIYLQKYFNFIFCKTSNYFCLPSYLLIFTI